MDGNRHVAVFHVPVHVRVLPEQSAPPEGVQLVRAVRRLYGGRGARPARRVRHLLVESRHTVPDTRRVDNASG